jgi:hypothetical protein
MCVIYFIRRHIFGLPLDQMCFSRDFLKYGQRTTVDTSLWRLVGKGILLRVADGVFVREGSKIPTAAEIANFAAELMIGSDDCDPRRDDRDSNCDDFEPNGGERDPNSDDRAPNIFGTDGQSSSFDTIHGRVRLVRVGGRKRSMGESKSAKSARALWYMKGPDLRWTAKALSALNRDDRMKLRDLICWMPAWLGNQFVRSVRPKKIVEPDNLQ